MSNDTYNTEPFNPNWHPSRRALIDYQAANYANMAAIALLAYDSLLTAPQARKHIFQRKFNIITLLYFLAQYGTLCELILNFVLEVDKTVATSRKCRRLYQSMASYATEAPLFLQSTFRICNPINLTYYLVFAAAGVGIQGLLLGRAYAAAYRNRKIMAALGTIFLISIGLAIGFVRWWRYDAFQGAGFTTLIFERRPWRPQEEECPSASFLFAKASFVLLHSIISAWSFADALSLKLARVGLQPQVTKKKLLKLQIPKSHQPLELILFWNSRRFLFQLRETAEPKDYILTTTETVSTTIWRTKGIIGGFRNLTQTILNELGDSEILTTRTDIEMAPRGVPPPTPPVALDELERRHDVINTT
ncbi:hypothetical protein M422DRAFT_44619 [Sphaerobolus stellatus SS14]|nr:hypothetical protein M422DRAFT_44619 [Sphaerobolus stellatus SS14]